MSPISRVKGKIMPKQGVEFQKTTAAPDFFNDRVESSKVIVQVGGGTLSKFWTHNVDPVHGEGDWKRKAQDTPWPIGTSKVDLILASHVMEHVPAGEDRISVMNEAWRVLKPGGLFCIVVPLLCDESTGAVFRTAVADPTHVSFWVRSSFSYFDGSTTANADYGIEKWNTLSFDQDRFSWEGRWVGSPVKDR